MCMGIFLGIVSTTINKFSKGFMTRKAQELLIQNIVYKRNDFSDPEKQLTNFWKPAGWEAEDYKYIL